ALVDWNRSILADLAGAPLDDPRVSLEVTDFSPWLRSQAGRFDAILLDLDNGPDALTAPQNASLYQHEGLTALRSALQPGGVLGVWSAYESPAFETRLRRARFQAETVGVRGRPREGKGTRNTVFLGRVFDQPGRRRGVTNRAASSR